MKMSHNVVFILLLGCLFSNAIDTDIHGETGQSSDISKAPCEPPFFLVGPYCLFIDNTILGTWSQLRGICQSFGGDLVNMKDANMLYDINKYIVDNGMDDVSYWVGANDLEQEGNWVWSSDNSSVKMGSPLWGKLRGNEPNGNSDENCGIISTYEFYYMRDDVCDFQHNGIICQPGISVESTSKDISLDSIQPRDCPYPFEVVGGACIHVYQDEAFGVSEARAYCESLSGHLVKIDDANFLGALCDHIIDLGINYNLFVDGSDDMLEGLWLFSDDTFMKRGTPFWHVRSEAIQEPDGERFDADYTIIYPAFRCRLHDIDDTYASRTVCQYDV